MGKKILSLFMVVCLLCTMLPVEAFASDPDESGPCSHHPEHTAECGYTAPSQAVPCGHICDEACCSEETVCLHIEHEETCGGMEDETLCAHVCSEENGCITRSQNCQHSHDEACSYAEGSEGTPCLFVCQDCAASEDPAEPETPADTADETEEPPADSSTADGTEEPAANSNAAEEEAEGPAPVLLTAEVPVPVAETSNIAYLNTGALWSASLYDYAVWAWPDGGNGHWVSPSGEPDANGWTPFDVGSDPNVIFAAIKKGQDIDWNNKVFQTVDLKYDPETPYFTLAAETNSEGKFTGIWEATVCSHSWTEEITHETSCSQNGLRLYTCSLCGRSYDEIIPRLPHTWNENNVCSVCGTPRPMIYIAWEQMYLDTAVTRRYDPWLWVTVQDGSGRWVGAEATCEFAGHSAFALEEDDTRFQFTLMPEGAEPSWENCVVKDSAPNLCPAGQDRHYVLGIYYEGKSDVLVNDPYAACEHQWEIEEITPVTCTQDGVFGCICGTCKLTYGRRTPATGHSKAPENLTVVTPATCTAAGEGAYTCETCQETVSVTIPAAGHQYVYAYDKLPTCTADGVKINRCKTCQEEAQGEAIPATGHSPMPEDPEKVTVVTAPNCYTDGESTYVCENCEQTVSVTVPATGHNYQPDEVVVAPGCTTTGGQIYLCANPGCTGQTGRDLPALGHDLDENHVCKRCSQEATILLTAADGSTAHYISMTDALLDANDTPDGATIQLLKDTLWEESRTDLSLLLFETQGPVVLDLKGFTLTCYLERAYHYKNSQFAIKNGSLRVTRGSYIFYLTNCRFTMEDVTVLSDYPFSYLVYGMGDRSNITMTNVEMQCHSGDVVLHAGEGTAELTDCIFYTGTEVADNRNAVLVSSTATLRINSGRYKQIRCVNGSASISQCIDQSANCYRYIDGNYIVPTDMTEIVNVDVVPRPFKVVGSTELLETPVGRPVTITPGYTDTAEDFDPAQLTFQWNVYGDNPQFTQNEDGRITITPSKAGTVTAYCYYLYRGYRAGKSVEITVTACTSHSYDSRGLCTYCGDYEPAEDTDGDGYVEITNPGNLWWFSQQVNGGNTSINAVLTADIDLSTTCGEGIGNWQPIGHKNGYCGHFNGQGFTVSNLYMTGNDQYVGLFGYVSGATIENVSVTGRVSSTFDYDESYMNAGAVGGVVAYLYDGTIRSCHVSMTVSGVLHVGGICGMMGDGSILGCTVDGTVASGPFNEGTVMLGGIVGNKHEGTVKDCVNRASIGSVNYGEIGGIVGANFWGTVENCLNEGDMNVQCDDVWGTSGLGGIAGNNTATIRSCANRGTITAQDHTAYVGGIAGWHHIDGSLLENSYTIGSITADSTTSGPIFGLITDAASVSNTCYLSDTETADGGRTAEQFASGQVAYELNSSVTADTNVWRQTIGSDACPVFSGALVYYGETFHCDGTSTGIFYHNAQPDTSVPPHTINRDTGLCTVCQTRIGCLRVTTGETDQYAMTLPEAAGLAGTETATITLLADLGTTEVPTAAFGSIACGSLLTFDLNGKTVTYSADSFVTVTAGKLIVTGSGTIQNADGENVNFKTVSSGNVKLRGGTYTDGITSSYQYIRDLLDDGYLFQSSTGGWFDCTITAPSITNNNFSVQPSPVEIIRIPSDTTIYRGEPVNLTIFATPRLEGTISYEWKYNNGNTTVDGSIFHLSTLTEYKTYEVTCRVKFKTTIVYQKTVRVTVEKCPHENAPNGFCSFCGSYVPAELVDGVYQIANGGNLFWFAAMVNGDSTHADFENQNTGANALLTADIDLENRQWAPIRNYTGTFDGGGHAISNFAITEYNLDTLAVTEYNADNTPMYTMYVGFFGYIENPAVVKNFTINGRIDLPTSGPAHGGYLGSAVAASGQDNQSNGGTIDRITSNVAINIGTGDIFSHGGGIAGALYGGTISRCIFDSSGSFSSSGNFNQVGGVVGYCQDTTIENCAFYGDVDVALATHVGGILGYVNNAGAIIRNNLCNGDVTGHYDQYTGAIIGRVKQNCGEVENNYFESAVMGIDNAFGSGSGFTFTKTAAYDISLDALLSGEVTWLLNGSKDNGVWTQTIDGSSYLPSFDQAPVYRWEPDEAGGVYTYANTPKPAGALSLDITWGDLSFTYTKGTWDPSTHTYSGEGWIPDETDGNCIAVTNNGELETSVSIRYDAVQGYEAITGTPSEAAAALPAGAEKKFWLTLTGKPAAELADVTIGTITLTIGGE